MTHICNMESTYNTIRTDSLGFPAGPKPCPEHRPWHYLSDQELGEERRGQGHALIAQPE